MNNYLLFLLFVIIIPSLSSFSQVVHEEDITVWKDIVYAVADGHELKLDIAVPKCLKSPAPAIVDIPGGEGRVVNKSSDDALFYAKYGFIGVSIIHRTSDIAPFPAAVHDCKTVIRWLRAHAKQYNINPDKIGVTGFSSGGHLAVLLGTSGGDDFLEGNGGYENYSSNIQSVVDHFGPTDFFKMNDTDLPDRTDVFSTESAPSLFLGGPLREKAEDKILCSGNIQIDDLSLKDKQIFFQKFEIEENDLIGQDIMWNFRGEIDISLFDEPYPIMYMQGEKYDPNIEGVGYHFRIKKDLTVDIEKKVYRKQH